MHPLAERIQNKDIRALAKAITMVENDHPEKLELLSDVFSIKNNAHYIGITGSPGAGKSSLVNRLITHVRNKGLTIAVIAVDPTSPFSGGALLGDRVRMNQHFTDPGVYIRSMATRGSLGGLARATKDAIRICDAYGFDVVLVETVGVGQSELDIMKVVDTTALVLTPNSGDVLQVFKAGIMEIADIFIINKADLPGVEKLKILLKDFMMITKKEEGHIPPIVTTISTDNVGVEEMWDHLKEHHTYLYNTDQGDQKRQEQFKLEVQELIREEMWRDVARFLDGFEKEYTIDQVKYKDPYLLAANWYEKWKQEGDK
ncbi:methylmalonyl Co-A mutase-associated GTPase MeaB [Aquibacillus sp. 3ASR75-11]|uniref:Methylmalonyl Co-A mutase-associated GTPase MeaB n=1 Tax=Terrihalobacillus insolitus TaxID=2950438 RepID=A0A9X4AMQ5_9BACI|nr:methylmalonyl Co-A mutase-associated GTPase MeaB [Terrihalobacillus insolitus]MDC3414951.1 methylmalonyl Co-A mutase-associated GTPase MeaB [Terrihalobacillus insolitus]MDC3425064.1 methylmalonyl Co-A mutase-associated GTPase MeaB [Terrihalobacillus insolitus]